MAEYVLESNEKFLNISSILLIMTYDCNLSCSYCFQNHTRNCRMAPETMYAALDFALSSPNDNLTVNFYGGEPLLEYKMIKEAVDYCSYESDYVKNVQYVIGTNGILLTDLVLDFLIAHNFQLTISFDGIPEAQSFRSPDTFSFLNRLLDRLRIQHRDYFYRKVQIAITLIPETIVYLADSIEYFMQKSVRSISIMPVITHCHNWSNDYYSMLDTQLGRVAATSLTHYSHGACS